MIGAEKLSCSGFDESDKLFIAQRNFHTAAKDYSDSSNG